MTNMVWKNITRPLIKNIVYEWNKEEEALTINGFSWGKEHVEVIVQVKDLFLVWKVLLSGEAADKYTVDIAPRYVTEAQPAL